MGGSLKVVGLNDSSAMALLETNNLSGTSEAVMLTKRHAHTHITQTRRQAPLAWRQSKEQETLRDLFLVRM